MRRRRGGGLGVTGRGLGGCVVRWLFSGWGVAMRGVSLFVIGDLRSLRVRVRWGVGCEARRRGCGGRGGLGRFGGSSGYRLFELSWGLGLGGGGGGACF